MCSRRFEARQRMMTALNLTPDQKTMAKHSCPKQLLP
jgi:hypothetical protein